MQVWIKTNNDSNLIYQALSIGLTTNIVGPFLSPESDLDIEKILTPFPHAKLWDTTIEVENEFTTLEVLAAKRAYNKSVGFIIKPKIENGGYHYPNYQLIHEIKSLTPDFVLAIPTADMPHLHYINLLNMDLNHILILKSFNNPNLKQRFDYRNHYMKKTRLGIDIDNRAYFSEESHVNATLYENKPDFITVDLERLKL